MSKLDKYLEMAAAKSSQTPEEKWWAVAANREALMQLCADDPEFAADQAGIDEDDQESRDAFFDQTPKHMALEVLDAIGVDGVDELLNDKDNRESIEPQNGKVFVGPGHARN